jgi:hypothetical protein
MKLMDGRGLDGAGLVTSAVGLVAGIVRIDAPGRNVDGKPPVRGARVIIRIC